MIRVKLFRKFVKVSPRVSVVSAGPAATRARHRSISLVLIVDSSWPSWAGFTGLLSQETLTTSVKDVSIVTYQDIVNHENRRGTWYISTCTENGVQRDVYLLVRRGREIVASIKNNIFSAK